MSGASIGAQASGSPVEGPQTRDRPRRARYESLDFWRGVACLSVVVYHSVLFYTWSGTNQTSSLTNTLLHAMSKLWIGVPVFFVISGYCIAATGDASRLRGDRLRTYFLRRFRRIYPPLWVVIAASIAFFVVVDVIVAPGVLSMQPWGQPRPWWYSGWQWVGNLTLTETWRHYLVGGPRGHFPGQAWTLCYEEQFYAVVGALLVFPRHFFKGIVAVTGGTLAVMFATRVAGVDVDGFFFDGNWLMFAAGILVYYEVIYASQRQRQLVGGLLLVCALVSLTVGSGAAPGSPVAFGFAAVLLGLHPFDRGLASSIWSAPIRLCGQMCYSLYLVHQILVRAISAGLARAGVQTGLATLGVTLPLCIGASVAVGWLFHCLVERRFLNSPRVDSTVPATVPSLDLRSLSVPT